MRGGERGERRRLGGGEGARGEKEESGREKGETERDRERDRWGEGKKEGGEEGNREGRKREGREGREIR